MVHVTWAIVIACGKGEQLSAEADIPFLSLGSRPVLAYSLLTMEQSPDIAGVVIVAAKERAEGVLGMSQMYGFSKVQKIVAGSTTRHSSVLNGLKALDDDVSIVLVHDASRPCVNQAMIGEVVKAAKRYGSGVLANEVTESIKESEKGLTVSRSLVGASLWAAQSPQAFKREILEKGYKVAMKKHATVEEDSYAVELLGEEVHIVPAPAPNPRIRSAKDFNEVAAMLKV